jgi:ferredoxin
VQIGALLAGRHPQAIDTVACALIGLTTAQVWTQQKALDTKRPFVALDQLELVGADLNELKLSAFRPSKVTDINFGLKGNLKKHLKHAITARPVVDRALCQLCNDCVNHCPPNVMKIEKRRLQIDYDRCIRCFCCQELCPHGALLTKQGLLLRLANFLRGDR